MEKQGCFWSQAPIVREHVRRREDKMAKSIRSKRKRKLRAEKREKLKPKVKAKLKEILGLKDEKMIVETRCGEGEKSEETQKEIHPVIETQEPGISKEEGEDVVMESVEEAQKKLGKKALKKSNKKRNLKRLRNKKKKRQKNFK